MSLTEEIPSPVVGLTDNPLSRSDWDLHNTKLSQTRLLDDPLFSCDCENIDITKTTSIVGECACSEC